MTESRFPAASAVLEDYFMPYTLTCERDGQTLTSICGITTTTVAIQRRDEAGRDQMVRAHILKVPTATAFTLRPGERVRIAEFQGEKYTVVGPYHSNLRLTKRYTVTEAR